MWVVVRHKNAISVIQFSVPNLEAKVKIWYTLVVNDWIVWFDMS